MKMSSHPQRLLSTVSSKLTVSPTRSDDFVDSWMKFQRRILECPVGSMLEKDWHEALEFVKVVRLHARFHLRLSTSARIQCMFEVLDRLAIERQNVLGSNEGGTSKSPCYAKTLDESSFIPLLVIWRDCVVALSELQPQRQQTNRVDVGKDSDGHYEFVRDSSSSTLLPSQVLQKIDCYQSIGLVPPNPTYYPIILHAMCFSQAAEEKDPEMADKKVFQPMLQRSRLNPFDTQYHPTIHAVYGMVELWARSSPQYRKDAPGRAQAYIKALEHWYEKTQRDVFKPNPNLYCALMEMHSRFSAPDVALGKIWQLWDQMKQNFSQNGEDEWNAKIYTRACYAFANCQHPEAADAANKLLNELIYQYKVSLDADSDKSGNGYQSRLKPDPTLFSTVLNAYSRAGRFEEAEEIFRCMEALAADSNDASIKPDVVCYSDLIWAHARAGNTTGAVRHIRQMVEMMEYDELRKNGAESKQAAFATRANVSRMSGWNAVLASWAESSDPNAPSYIRLILDKLEKIVKDKDGSSEFLTAYNYNILLSCYARQGTIEAAEAVEDVFRWMQHQGITNSSMRPDRDSYLNVILAWCNAGKPERAQAQLTKFYSHMKTRNEGDDRELSPMILDQQHFTIVMEAWAKSEHAMATHKAMKVFRSMQRQGIPGNVVSYTSLLWSWAKSSEKSIDPAKPIIEIFEEMKSQWETGDEFCRPNLVTYNAVIFGLARSRSPKALDRASKYFRQMTDQHGLQPTDILYNTLMSAWSQRNRPDKTMALFREMQEAYKKGNTKVGPNHKLYRTCLWAWSKAGEPEHTSSFLREWIQAFDSGAVKEPPLEREFGAVLQAWLRSQRPEGPAKAEEGLREMLEFAESNRFDFSPSVFSFTSVISAYAKTAHVYPDAGLRALRLFRTLEDLARKRIEEESIIDNSLRSSSLLEPNLLTYSETILALIRSANSNPSLDTVREVKQLFDQMIHERIDDPDFWTNFRSSELLEKLHDALSNSSMRARSLLMKYCKELDRIARAANRASPRKVINRNDRYRASAKVE